MWSWCIDAARIPSTEAFNEHKPTPVLDLFSVFDQFLSIFGLLCMLPVSKHFISVCQF